MTIATAAVIALVFSQHGYALANDQFMTRVNGVLPYSVVSGQPITGAQSMLYVYSHYIDTTISSADPYIINQSDGTFAQIGTIQGYVGMGHCNVNSSYYFTPHYFFGEKTRGDSCETLYDLGVASLNTFTLFEVRLNLATHQPYGFINGVQRIIGTSNLTTSGMQPGVAGESDDTCSLIAAYAHNPPGQNTMAAYFGGSYHIFQEQWSTMSVEPGLEQYYSISQPYGASTFYGDGPNSNPHCP
ncbi:MAG: hypothetical protein M3O46_14000 [Myxococcota bacterium]|nr:hypothetical protein [Myxococcota bacterium]